MFKVRRGDLVQSKEQWLCFAGTAVKLFVPGLLFVGSFLITVSISVLVMGLLRFSISSWFSFGKLYFSKNLSIPSKDLIQI